VNNLYLSTKEEFEKESIDLDSYVEKQVRRIVEQVDEMTIHNVPTETLLKIKTKIDEELKNREYKLNLKGKRDDKVIR
jgi:hypothetical protein